jgi:hypothetical protein
MPDPYDVLGVGEDATDNEIEAAYRRLVEIYHPDRFSGNRPEVRAEAERRMHDLNVAHDQLRGRRRARRSSRSSSDSSRSAASGGAPPFVSWNLRSWTTRYRRDLSQTLVGLGVAHTLRGAWLAVPIEHQRTVETILSSIARRRPDLGLPPAVPSSAAR